MSSPIAHAAAGYAVYSAFRSKLPEAPVFGIPARVAWPVMIVLSCLIPDLDVVTAFSLGSFERFHNNLSHSILVCTAIPLMAAPLMKAFTRLSLRTSFWLILACCYSHILIDLFTMGRGVMIFWPFSSIRLHAPISLFVGVPWSAELTNPLYLLTTVNDLCFAAAMVAAVFLIRNLQSRVNHLTPGQLSANYEQRSVQGDIMNENPTALKKLFALGIKLAAWGFFCISMVCFLLVGLMIWKGDVWAHIIYAEKPVPHFLGGAGALFAWYFLIYGTHNTRKEWTTLLAKVLLLTLGVAVSLAAGEIILRKYYSMRQEASSMERFKAARKNGKPLPVHSTHPLATIVQPSDNQKLIYELQPHLDTEFGHVRVRTNTEGMREDRDYTEEPPTGTVRIVGIGDSGMYGWDIEQNEDYMGVLEANLNSRKDGTFYEVLNLGVPGYNTQLEVEMLRYRGLKYKPAIVIVGWCENDFSLPYFLMEKNNYWRWNKSYLYILLFERNINRTEVAPGLTIRDLREYDKKAVLPELTSGTDPKGVGTAMTDLLELSRTNGFKVLFFGPMKETVIGLCKELGMPYACTYEMIPDDKYPANYLVHNMHPAKEGHRVLAEYLEQDLVRRGWIPPAVKSEN